MTPVRTWRVSRYRHRVVTVGLFGGVGKKKTFPHTGNVLQMGGDGIGVNPSRRGKRQDRHLSRRGDVSRRPPSPPEEEEEEEQREEEEEEKHPRASPALKAGGVTSERD